MRLAALSAVAGAALLVVTAPASAARPDKLIVFGDSLVDAGNAYLGTGGLTAQPSLGYFNGRFSNGPVYTDLINARLTGSYTTPYLAGGDNYAVGGARAASDAFFFGGAFTVPGLQSQLGIYAGVSGGIADPNALYVLNFGNNDVSAIQNNDTYTLVGGVQTPVTIPQYETLYVSNFVNAIVGLQSAGATKILIAGVPNPLEPEGVALQAKLDFALDTLEASPFLTTTLYRFDFFDFFDRLRANPTAFGLPATADLDPTHGCIPTQLAFGFPPDCTQYFSFDGIHPTEPVHVALAQEVGRLIGIGAVPEPAVWAQMIAGFGFAGIAMRRRQRALAG